MAKREVYREDIGETVICDMCGADWTNRTEHGGILFVSKACCPECAPKIEKEAVRYGETHLIRKRCPETIEFRKWVLFLRAGVDEIRVYEADSIDDLLEGSDVSDNGTS